MDTRSGWFGNDWKRYLRPSPNGKQHIMSILDIFGDVSMLNVRGNMEVIQRKKHVKPVASIYMWTAPTWGFPTQLCVHKTVVAVAVAVVVVVVVVVLVMQVDDDRLWNFSSSLTRLHSQKKNGSDKFTEARLWRIPWLKKKTPPSKRHDYTR